MTPTGLERTDDSTGNNVIQGQGGAESGAVGAQSALMDPDLRAVIEAWPELPDAVKAGILAMVRAAGGER
ncbi:MAG: hypothetical protein IH899_01785 [Planctomycetes bacterium]|nr:hypothetical protein [Planctomycetota bacterium]